MQEKPKHKPIMVLHDEECELAESALHVLIKIMESHREEIEEGMRLEREACEKL